MSWEKEIIENYRFFEYPFMHRGITRGEFLEELRYFGTHQDEVRNKTYTPLWKQRIKKDGKR